MLLNKKLFYFSFFTSLFTLILSIILNFCFDNDVVIFICNILLNIFAGTLVLMVTSLFDYFIQKRRVLTAIMDKIHKYRKRICSIEYLDDINNYPSYERYVEYYKERKSIKFTRDNYEEEKKRNLKKHYKKMNDIIVQYRDLLTIDFTDMWLLYDELYFISPFEVWRKKRKWIYENVFKYISDLLNEIQKCCYYFDLYKEDKQFEEECYNILLEFQKRIFVYEKLYGEDYNWSYDLKDDEYPRYSGASVIDNSHFIVINIFEKHLSKMFKEVHKLNYHKKKKKKVLED